MAMPTSMMPTSMRGIVVAGGGTAGWMSAAYLRRRTRQRVTLVESAGIGTIGVGEATIPALIDFVQGMKIPEDDFLRGCHATYKLAIRFEGWTREGVDYWHPFGLCGGRIDGIDVFHHWLRAARAKLDVGSYTGYSLQAELAAQKKAHRPVAGEPVVPNYAFHLDAAAFAELLKGIALADGVEHVVADISAAEIDPTGTIRALRTASGHQLPGDLFIDCTGFRGLLIERQLGEVWVDWSDTLLCDRAVVLRRPVSEAMPPYTRATAKSAGWAWEIPLSHRTGHGYVYSSGHQSDESAALELLEQARAPEKTTELRRLEMRVGRRAGAWRSNCVAIGLSAGFIEPLESTGIFLIQRGLEELIECFPSRSLEPGLRNLYNERIARVYDDVRDFVLLHYLLTERDEHAFWRDARRVAVPDSLARLLELYDASGMILESERNPVFRETNYLHILAGGGRFPEHGHPRVGWSDLGRVVQLLHHIRRQNGQVASKLPLHQELMAAIHGSE
jgi:tryptophan halogenase